ncbi:MAG: hypothetical protein JXR73_16555 [Candidatus Omnitrophica bacterium]|nr:hypothetical protein [Candidatus Omnitrophota bacterium]
MHRVSRKKRFVVFLLLIGGASFITMAADQPYEVTAPVSFYAEQRVDMPPITIDGFIDGDEWRFSPQSSDATNSFWSIRWDPAYDVDGAIQTGLVDSIIPDDAPVNTADCSCTVFTLYDDEYLYIAVRVLDDYQVFPGEGDAEDGSEDQETWNDDSVEIFIDGDYSRFDTTLTSASADDQAREFATGGQFVITTTNARRDKEAGDPSFGEDADWYGRAELLDDLTGYEVEFKIKLSIIGNPAKGSKIGFNLAINDDDGGDGPRYQLRWCGDAHLESSYGTLYFGPREVTAPLVEGPVAIDGVMDESDWSLAAVETVTPYEGVLIEDIMPGGPDDLSFIAYIMHDDTWLYVGIDVTDQEIIHDTEPEGSHNANTWYDDSAEVFIDQDLDHGIDTSNNRYGSPELIEGQFVLTAGNATRDENTSIAPFIGETEGDDWWGWATTRENGWTGEMRFKKEMIASNERIGFTMTVNDDDVGGTEPDYQLRWQGTPHVESSYGVLILGGPPTEVQDWMIH